MSTDNIRVLIVDDSRQMRQSIIECILTPNGFAVIEAKDGEAGLRKALAEDVDLILMDYEMPKMNGGQVIDALRQREVDTPIVLMTSHGSEEIAVEVFRKGVRDYVIKPFEPDEMLQAIKRALREVHLKREKDALTNRLVQANRQLEQRVRELNTLYKVGKSVAALTERDKLLGRITDAALYITGAEEVAIFFKDDRNGSLTEFTRRRRTEGRDRQVSHRTEGQLAEDAVRKGDATMTGAMLYAPLQLRGKSIGALGVSNKVTSRFFNEHDKRLLKALADYAAIAIENANLVEQIAQAKEREKKQIRGVFEQYVAPSVVEKLVEQPEALKPGGTRQESTILFADIRGFSDYSVRVTPEQLVEVLNKHIAVAADAILAEGGTLDKFLGDAVMAYFNAPLPQDDHQLRAVRAAWRIMEAMKRSHDQLPRDARLQFGVGISTGEILVGNIGTSKLMNFTVIGDAVNVSRRLQEHARGGQILISRSVYEDVHTEVEAKPVGMVQLKGHTKPEPVFEITAVKL